MNDFIGNVSVFCQQQNTLVGFSSFVNQPVSPVTSQDLLDVVLDNPASSATTQEMLDFEEQGAFEEEGACLWPIS